MQFLRFDNDALDQAFAAAEAPVRDERLRLLVDSLEGTRRYVLERIFFGGAALAQVARELGFSTLATAEIRNEALAQLRGWLEGGVEPPEPSVVTDLAEAPSRRCEFLSPWGRCQQPAKDSFDWCAFHVEMIRDDLTPDEGYHRRVVLGETVPVQAKISPKAQRTVLYGVRKGDGRSSDQYTLPDQTPWEVVRS